MYFSVADRLKGRLCSVGNDLPMLGSWEYAGSRPSEGQYLDDIVPAYTRFDWATGVPESSP